eukprot:5851521-Prymnesium_polylepis.1
MPRTVAVAGAITASRVPVAPDAAVIRTDLQPTVGTMSVRWKVDGQKASLNSIIWSTRAWTPMYGSNTVMWNGM